MRVGGGRVRLCMCLRDALSLHRKQAHVISKSQRQAGTQCSLAVEDQIRGSVTFSGRWTALAPSLSTFFSSIHGQVRRRSQGHCMHVKQARAEQGSGAGAGQQRRQLCSCLPMHSLSTVKCCMSCVPLP